MIPEACDIWVKKARKDSPEGIWCGHCGAINQFADDIGWFYTDTLKGEYKASCGCVPVHTAER